MRLTQGHRGNVPISAALDLSTGSTQTMQSQIVGDTTCTQADATLGYVIWVSWFSTEDNKRKNQIRTIANFFLVYTVDAIPDLEQRVPATRDTGNPGHSGSVITFTGVQVETVNLTVQLESYKRRRLGKKVV